MKSKSLPVKLLFLGLILFLLASIVVIGCSKATTTPSQTTSTKPTTVTTTTTTAPPTTKIKTGGILKVAMPMDAMILGDPQETKQVGAIMQRASLEFLARFDSKGDLQPWLADSWSEDPANLTFTVKLKQGIKFQDGTDFNAAAVKFNWDRFIAAKSNYTANVDHIDAVDNYTVAVRMKSWVNSLPDNLCFWAGAMVSPTAWQKNGEAWGKLNPVGTGPFQFVSWTPDSKIIYKKFDGYWQKGKPYLDGIEFSIIADEATRTASFKSGEVDVIDQATVVQSNDLSKVGKYVVADVKTGICTGVQMLTFDAGKPNSVFTDLKVRQAVAYAIDKKTIVDNTYYGYGVAADQYAAGPSNWGYNPNLTKYLFNPDKARQLLKEAGRPSIQTTITILDNLTQYTAISGMLADVGITAKVNLVPGGAWFTAATQGWDGILGTPSPSNGDITTRFGFTTSTSMFCISALRPVENDKLVAAMSSATSFDQKKALAQAYQQRIFGDLVSNIMLWFQDNMAVKYPYVKNDNFCTMSGHEWTPEDIWLDK